MAEPVKDYDKLVAEEGRDDEAILNDLEKESREFVKVNGILHSHIMSIQC
jgi:hypothetical protein